MALAAAKKLITGDANWSGNRPSEYRQNLWHNFNGQHYNNVLWGDNHVSFFQFPKAIETNLNYQAGYDVPDEQIPEPYRPDPIGLYRNFW